MKGKQIWIALLAIVPAALGVLSACGRDSQGVAPPYSGQHGSVSETDEFAPPADDPVKLDGVLDEESYADVVWKEWNVTAEDVENKKDESKPMAGIDVRATVVYGQKGFYTSFEVKGSSVYVDLDHVRYRFCDTGISPYIGFYGTSHNYEIFLTADGEVSAGSYVGGSIGFGECDLPGVRSSAAVYDAEGKLCEINTDDAQGYIIEAYFPWMAFGYEVPQAAVMMDVAAIKNSETVDNKRDGWVSMGDTYKQDWSWSNPNTYWYWGNGGFESSAITLTVDDYDKDSGTVSFAKTEYRAFDDIEIELSPEDGYLLSSVKVNGAEMRDNVKGNKLVLERYCGALDLVVSAEFKPEPTDAVTISGKAQGYAGASVDWALPEGTTIVFAGELVYNAEVGANGAYSVKLARGEYTVSADGFVSQTLNVTEGGTQNLRLRWELIEKTTNYTVSADESEAYVTASGKWQSAAINTLSERFTLSYTIKMMEGKTSIGDYDNMGLRVFFGEGNANSYLIQMLHWNGNLYAKITKDGSNDAIGGQTQLTDDILTVQQFLENGAKVTILGSGGTLTYFICDAEGVWHRISEVSNVKRITLMNWTTNAYFDDIAYCDGEDPVKYTVGGKMTVHGGASGEWLLPVGTQLTFTGPTVTTATLGADGSYSARLSLGTYTVTAEGCEPCTLTVTGDATANLSASWKLFADTNLYTKTGTSMRPVIQNASVGMNFLSDKFVLRYRVRPQSGKTLENIGYIYVKGSVGGTPYAFSVYDYNTGAAGHQLFADVRENGAMIKGTQASITNGKKWITIDEFNQNGIELLLVRNGTTFDYYVQDAKGVWQKVFTLADKDITDWQLLCTATGAEITDISYSDGLDGLNIVLDAHATNGSVELGGTYKLGEDVELNLTPAEGCILKSILIDGVDKTADVQNDKLVITKYMRLIMTVEVTFEEHVETYEVSGTATAYAGASKAWDIPDGTELTFTNSKQLLTKTTVSGGKYTAQLAIGSYTVTAEGYTEATVEIAGAETENIVLRYDLLGTADVWTVGEDESTAKASIKSDGGKWLPIHTGRGTFTLIYRVKGVEGAAATNDAMTDGAGYFVLSDTFSDDSRGYQCGFIDGGYAFRMSNEWSGNHNLALTAEQYANNGVWVMLVCESGTIKAYYKLNAADAWTKSSIHDLTLPQDAAPTLYTWNANVCFDNISYEPYLPEVTVETSVMSAEETGSVTVEPLRYGGTLKVTASPADGYELTSLKVNGVEHIGDVQDDTYTVENFREFTAAVEATFSLIPEETYTVSGRVTGIAGASEPWAIPENTQLTFTGDSVGQATVGADGAYSVELAAGSYTVTAEHLSGTLTVEGEASDKNIQLRWDLIPETENYVVDATETEAKVQAGKRWQTSLINLIDGDFVFFYTIRMQDGKTLTGNTNDEDNYDNINPYIWADGIRYRFVCWSNGSGYSVEIHKSAVGNPDSETKLFGFNGLDSKINSIQNFGEHGQKCMLVREGNEITWYLFDLSEKWFKVGSFTITSYEKAELMNWTTGAMFDEMSLYAGLDALNVELDISDFVNGSVKASKDAYKLGDDIVLNVTPQDGFELQSLLINEVEMASSVLEGVLTLENFASLKLTVKATFVEKQEGIQVSGKATAIAGVSSAWNIPDGTMLTFTGDVTHTAVVHEGAYSVELPKGQYTVSAEGYGTATLTVEGETSDKNIQLRWDLIPETDNYIVNDTESEAKVQAGKAYQTAPLNLVDGDFVFFYTIRLQDGKKLTGNDNAQDNYDNMSPYIWADGDRYNFTYWSNCTDAINIAIKRAPGGNNDADVEGSGHSAIVSNINTVQNFSDHGQKCLLVRKGNEITWYLFDLSENWFKVGSFTITSYEKAELMNWTTGAMFDEMSFSMGLDALNVSLNIGDFAGGKVTAEKDSYTLGENIVLNIAPQEGFDLVHLYVNDVDLVGSVSENKLTLNGNMKLKLDVRAEFEQPQNVQISGTAKAVAGASSAWDIPDGTTLTFTKGGAQGVTAEVTGGTYSVELLTGAYTVTAEGYLPLTYAVTSGGTEKNLELRWNLIAEADTYTVNENETQADAKTASSAIDVNLTEGDFVLFVTFKLKSGTLETYEALGGKGDGAKFSLRTIQFVSSDGVAANNVFASYYRYYADSPSKLIRAYLSKTSAGAATTAAGAQHNVLTEDAYKITDEEFTQTGMRTMCVLKGTTFSFYIKPTSGPNAEKWTLVGTIEDVSGFSKAVLQGSGSSNRRFADISYYPGTEKFDELGLEG